MSSTEVFTRDRYIARRKVFKIFGGAFTLHDPQSFEILAYVRQKAFKLREDITVFTDERMQEELLLIKARQIIDFAAAYDVTIAATGERVGTLRRKGLSSIIRDRWQIIDSDDREVGEIVEDSTALALVRRFLSNLVPQKFHIQTAAGTIGTIRQYFNPFVLKYDVDLGGSSPETLDRRLGVAAAVLLLAIEGRQN